MRNAVSRFLLVGFFVAATAGTVFAQIRGVRLNVPFPFTAVDQTFKPGMYDFVQDTPNSKLAIRGRVGKDGIFATTNLPSKSPFDPDLIWLIFHRYGDKYFLSEIWAHHLGVQFPVGEEEKKLRESGAENVDIRVNVK